MGITEKFNLLEALLWFVTGTFTLTAASTHFAPRYHKLVILTGLLFLFLGGASFAEFVVVAMSAPLWLLAWKTVNVACLLICVTMLFWEHRPGRKHPEHHPEQHPGHPAGPHTEPH